MNEPKLSQEAQLAQMSLKDHPHIGTPEGIANGPYGIDQVEAAEIHQGLVELQAHGLATESGGVWHRS